MLISRFYKPNKKYFIVKHIAISIYYYVEILRHYTWFELLLLAFVQEQSIVSLRNFSQLGSRFQIK